ncbi:MAG TPA: HD domain-containing phosphohydrolase [Anaerolineales bacterium]|nr:HD domain-containing phosphohydrolase [Anaerolineales bacterium]
MVKTKIFEFSKSLIVIAVLIWLAIAALGTIFLPGETGEIREMFAFSQIIPILVAAFYFGQAGGLLAAFAASLVSGSLVIANIDDIDSIFVQRVMFQIISFNSVALLTSFLSDQAKAHRRRLTRQVDRLNALRAIDKAIISGGDLNNTLYILLESLTRLLNVEASAIFLFDPKTEQLRLSASLGFFGEYPHESLCNLGEGMVGQAAAEKQTIYHHNLEKVDKQITPAVKGEGVMDYYAVPLFANDRLRGVLEVYDRAPRLDSEWKSYLETLAGQAAIAIAQSTLLGELKDANKELSEAYEETLKGWSRALNLRDKETDHHTQRVVELSVQLAERMGVRGEHLIQFERGAILHDIGKMGIPNEILLKPGKLSEEEWLVMRKHPLYAQMLIAPITYLEPAIAIPLYHHERWDGSGYPFGLHGTEIPLEARVFAIIDVWDALRSDRPYRKALSDQEALSYIEAQSGKQFDPEVVRVFNEMLNSNNNH